jgi:hypothetical protein
MEESTWSDEQSQSGRSVPSSLVRTSEWFYAASIDDETADREQQKKIVPVHHPPPRPRQTTSFIPTRLKQEATTVSKSQAWPFTAGQFGREPLVRSTGQQQINLKGALLQADSVYRLEPAISHVARIEGMARQYVERPVAV